MIRPATVDDLSRIAEILVFGKRTAYRAIFRDDEGSFRELQVLPVVEAYRRDDGLLRDTYVYDDGIVKGMLRASRGAPEAELYELYVDPFFWRMGIGMALMAFFLEAVAGQTDAVSLWVIQENAPARVLYESYGFVPTGETRLVEGTSVPELRYRLAL